MTAHHHDAIAAGANANAAIFNAPLGQLDAALLHATSEYARTTDATTTVTTNGTLYAVTGWEIAFTPKYAGQTFLIALAIGNFYSNTAGTFTARVNIVSAAGATIEDTFLQGRHETTGTDEYHAVSAMRIYTAAGGDVGLTRYARLYVTHTSDGATVTTGAGHISATTHDGFASPESATESSYSFAGNTGGSTMIALEVVPDAGVTLSSQATGGRSAYTGAFDVGGSVTGTGLVIAAGMAKSVFSTAGTNWTKLNWETKAPGLGNYYLFAAYNGASGTLANPNTASPTTWGGGYLALPGASIRQAVYGTAGTTGFGIFLAFPTYGGTTPPGKVRLSMPLQPLIGSWIVTIQASGQWFGGGLGSLPAGWTNDGDYTSDPSMDIRLAHHAVTT